MKSKKRVAVTQGKNKTQFNLGKYNKILVVRLSAIGDVLETLPAVHALRQGAPQAYIGWVLEEAPYSLLQGHPDIDGFFLFPKKELKSAIHKKDMKKVKALLKQLGDELKKERFDLVIDMHNLFKSGVVALLSGVKERVGYDLYREGSRFFLTEHIRPPKGIIHFVDWQMNLVRQLSVGYPKVEFVLPYFAKEEEFIRDFREKSGISGKFFCLAPGTSWPNKSWTSEGMARLSDRLDQYGQVVVIGSEQDRALGEEVISKMETIPVNALEKLNLRELAVLLGQAELYIGGDTGPMHLAVAVGTQVVAWFGPTCPEKTGPYQENAVIIKGDLPCQPCFKRKCQTVHCLKELKIETVWDSIQPLLE